MTDHVSPPPPPSPAARAGGDIALHEWQHLHPLSPVLRGGIVGVAVLGYAGSQLVDDVFAGLGGGRDGADGGGGRSDEGFRDGLGYLFDHSLVTVAVVLVALGLVGLVGWLSWSFSKFRVAGGQIEFRKGWLFREHRQVPLERVQAIEISRPLLAQVTGLSQVIVQSAGGGDSHLKLAFLGAARAEEVRRELLALAGRRDEAARVQAGPDGAPLAVPPDGTDEGREVLRVPNSRLFVATILHGGTILLGAIGLLVGAVALAAWGSSVEVLTGALIALPALGPLVFGLAVNRVGELLKHGNFRLSDTGTAARVQHGLTDKRTTTIPLHRIQAVGMVQPMWWRPFDWWRVRVNVAGIADGATGNGDNETTVLPVGTLDQALAVLTLLDPDLSEADLRRAALGDGVEGGWTLVSERARPLDPLSWHRSGFAVSEHSLMLRTGRWWRRVSVMPHARVQSLRLTQGPLDSRLGLVTVALVSTPGPVDLNIQHLDAQTGATLLRNEASRARLARAISRTACTGRDLPSQLVPPDRTDER